MNWWQYQIVERGGRRLQAGLVRTAKAIALSTESTSLDAIFRSWTAKLSIRR